MNDHGSPSTVNYVTGTSRLRATWFSGADCPVPPGTQGIYTGIFNGGLQTHGKAITMTINCPGNSGVNGNGSSMTLDYYYLIHGARCY